jgi:c-di-GMP-related signal transduction protein
MLAAVSKDELDLRELEQINKTEASVLYRLLRYLNSPMFGMRNEIHSIRHPLAMLGERETRRWIRLVALVSAGLQSSSDLVLSALVRARFCELLSMKIPRTQSDLFLVGMVSMMDAILGIPMEEIQKVALDKETKSVRSGGGGRCSRCMISCSRKKLGNGRQRKTQQDRCASAKVKWENCGARRCSGRASEQRGRGRRSGALSTGACA